MAGKRDVVKDLEGRLSGTSLKHILTNTIETIENNKSQIFDIYQIAKTEVERSREMLEEIREKARQSTERVDSLTRKEQEEKQNLVRVSSNFHKYTEKHIKASYESVKTVQVALAIEREKEEVLRAQRDKMELRMQHLQRMLEQAEHLAMAIGSVLAYLSSQINGVVWKMEAVQKDKFVGARIIKAQEEERYRISREIHDGPAQDLANLMFQTSIAEKLIDFQPDEAKRTLQELRQQIRDCLTSVRQIIFDMRPMALDDLGLVPALQQLVAKLATRGILSTEFSVDGEEYTFPKHIEIALFRIVQEGLNNVAHHSGVKKADLRLRFTDQALSLLIEDQGNGFDMEARKAELENDVESDDSGLAVGEEAPTAESLGTEPVKKMGHFGMVGMEERARIIGADFNVMSKPGEGTRVHVRISRKQAAK